MDYNIFEEKKTFKIVNNGVERQRQLEKVKKPKKKKEVKHKTKFKDPINFSAVRCK